MIPDLLARPFADDPVMQHVIEAGEDRHRRLFALFAAAVRACDLCGGIAASHHDGRPVAAAIWLPMTHVPVPLPTMVRSGMIWLPFVNGFAVMLRLHRHEAPCEERLGRHLDASSGYL